MTILRQSVVPQWRAVVSVGLIEVRSKSRWTMEWSLLIPSATVRQWWILQWRFLEHTHMSIIVLWHPLILLKVESSVCVFASKKVFSTQRSWERYRFRRLDPSVFHPWGPCGPSTALSSLQLRCPTLVLISAPMLMLDCFGTLCSSDESVSRNCLCGVSWHVLMDSCVISDECLNWQWELTQEENSVSIWELS